MSHRVFVALLLLWTLPFLGGALADVDLGFHRVLYGPWNSTYEAKVGIDADYDHTWWTLGPERALDKFRRDSLDAAEHNITYLAGLYYLGDEVDFDYVRAVHKTGEKQVHTPSPVDKVYWRRIVEEPALAVANLSLYYPIRGLSWDFELYLAEEPWKRSDYSFDIPAVRAFANESRYEVPSLAPGGGYAWLVGKGLLEEFKGWQERTLYEMARETQEKVHTMNPDFLLGDLNIRDTWFHWAILEGFSTPRAPVMAWTEETYDGYHGPNKVKMEDYRRSFEERGLNGKVIPGFYTPIRYPWELLEDMEWATRLDGVFWVYQYDGNPYRLADEPTYGRVYELVDRYIFFNRSRAEPLTSFALYPGALASPYDGPEGVSVLIRPLGGLTFPEEINVLTKSPDLEYIGRNLSVLGLEGPNLSLHDLPCIISGLQRGDLLPTETLSLIREMGSLLESFNTLGLGRLESLETSLKLAKEAFGGGRYEEARSILAPMMEDAYDQVLEAIWPTVEEAQKSPRTSSLPLSVLSKMAYVKKKLGSEDGERLEGQTFLLAGLREWSLAVDESIWLWSLGASIAAWMLWLIRSEF